jgi:hypothetical protein
MTRIGWGKSSDRSPYYHRTVPYPAVTTTTESPALLSEMTGRRLPRAPHSLVAADGPSSNSSPPRMRRVRCLLFA